MKDKENALLVGWRFENSYAALPERFYTKLAPSAVREPQLVVVNHAVAGDLGLDFAEVNEGTLAGWFSGNDAIVGAEPLAQAYAGHQFGGFNYLGDGRAHLLGEQITPTGERVDIGLKGSGCTPYGRRGDGRAALGPMLREYIMSEAMFALGIPTTRSLAVCSTGEPVYRETMLQGAVLTRVAASHIRVGTFEFLAAERDFDGMKILADYTIARHYPECRQSATPYVMLLKVVIQRQIDLVVEWMRVGFIHGVMNTDNVSIAGETIDYGPCAFMNIYDPKTVYSSIDRRGRYAFANQRNMIGWNLTRFAESILPLLGADSEAAVRVAQEVMAGFEAQFDAAWLAMMRRKIGLFGEQDGDAELVDDLLDYMEQQGVDYTQMFRDLCSEKLPVKSEYQHDGLLSWYARWQQRALKNDAPQEESAAMMRAHNPAFIPRNHRVEEALAAAEDDADLTVMQRLLAVLSVPYEDDIDASEYAQLPDESDGNYKTFCGT